MAQNQAIQANPLFGRPQWTYTNVVPGPVRGPQPRLARGSGPTGGGGEPGTNATLPGYLTDNEYRPNEFSYAPANREDRILRLPRAIKAGVNGRDLVGTYQPHDRTMADRFNMQMRSASNWQVMEFPPDFRNLLAWKQVEKYRVMSQTIQARPLTQSDYFLGYQVGQTISGQIGQSSLGTLGSNG